MVFVGCKVRPNKMCVFISEKITELVFPHLWVILLSVGQHFPHFWPVGCHNHPRHSLPLSPLPLPLSSLIPRPITCRLGCLCCLCRLGCLGCLRCHLPPLPPLWRPPPSSLPAPCYQVQEGDIDGRYQQSDQRRHKGSDVVAVHLPLQGQGFRGTVPHRLPTTSWSSTTSTPVRWGRPSS